MAKTTTMQQQTSATRPRPASPARHARRGRRAGHARNNAFTLLELVVVLTVIAVVASVAAPRMSATSARYGVRAAAYRVASDLDSTAERARTTGSAHTVVFRTAESAYAVMNGPPDNTQPPALSFHRLDVHPYRCQLVAQFSSTADRIGFDAFGRSTNDGVAAVRRGDFLIAITAPIGSGVAKVGSLQVVPKFGMGQSFAIGQSITNAAPLGARP